MKPSEWVFRSQRNAEVLDGFVCRSLPYSLPVLADSELMTGSLQKDLILTQEASDVLEVEASTKTFI